MFCFLTLLFGGGGGGSRTLSFGASVLSVLLMLH